MADAVSRRPTVVALSPPDTRGPGDPVKSMPQLYDVHVSCCVNERTPKHKHGGGSEKGARQLCDCTCQRSMALGLQRVRINRAGSLNRCEPGPTIVIYPEGVWYACRSEAAIDEIPKRHIVNGGRGERLLLRHDQDPRHRRNAGCAWRRRR